MSKVKMTPIPDLSGGLLVENGSYRPSMLMVAFVTHTQRLVLAGAASSPADDAEPEFYIRLAAFPKSKQKELLDELKKTGGGNVGGGDAGETKTA